MYKRFSSPRYDVLWLLLIAVLLFVVNLWGYPLFDVDEPRYAETAREMLTSPGDWITPHFNWMIRFDKPVLFYWLIAIMYKLFGVSEGSARLVSALSGTLTMVMVYAVGRFSINRTTGIFAALIFATMLEVFALSRWSVTDMTLACTMAGTWLGLFLAATKNPKWYLVAGVFAGLGLLTKGPVALVLPGGTLVLALLLFWRDKLKTLLSPWLFAGLGLSALIAVPWYWAVIQANPDTFINSFFLEHNLTRFSGTVSGHTGPWYYYFPVILMGAFPWSVFIPGVGLTLWAQKKSLPALVQYAALWFGVVFLFFSVAGTKLLTYVLPGFAALSLCMAYAWSQWQADKLSVNVALWNRIGAGGALIGVSTGLGVLLLMPLKLVPANLHAIFQPWHFQVVVLLLTLTWVSTYRWISQKQTQLAFYTLAFGFVLTLWVANVVALPHANMLAQGDTVVFAQRAVVDNTPMATYSMKKPSLVFYTQRKVYFMPDPNNTPPLPTEAMGAVAEGPPLSKADLQNLYVQVPSLYVVVKNKHLSQFKQHHGGRLIQTGRVYSLVHLRHATLRKDLNE